jgi:SAM-dependent methyltransferase
VPAGRDATADKAFREHLTILTPVACRVKFRSNSPTVEPGYRPSMMRDAGSRDTDGGPRRPAAPADVYTHGHHESVLQSHRRRTAANSAAYLVPHLRPGDRLLDVGCGPGTITADLAALVTPAQVVAVDRAADVLAEARLAVPDADIRLGDVYALADPGDTFDVTHAHQVLQHLTDPVAALVEMRRVTRPGGLVAVRDADYGAFTWWPQLPGLDDWLELYHAVARANGAEPDAGRRLVSWARAAGFTNLTAGASTWCFASDADRSWWSRSWAGRVTASDFAVQARDRGLASASDLAGIAQAWREWGEHPDGWLAIVHGEVLATA